MTLPPEIVETPPAKPRVTSAWLPVLLEDVWFWVMLARLPVPTAPPLGEAGSARLVPPLRKPLPPAYSMVAMLPDPAVWVIVA